MSYGNPAKPQLQYIEPVDVLIITAAEAGDDAVRLVEEGALDSWKETPGPPSYGFTVCETDISVTTAGK
jgi:hypothetical protein